MTEDRLARLYTDFKAAPKGTRHRRHLRRAVQREARRRVSARDRARETRQTGLSAGE